MGYQSGSVELQSCLDYVPNKHRSLIHRSGRDIKNLEQEINLSVERERGMAELVIRVELSAGGSAQTAKALEDHIARELNLRPRIVVVDQLPRYELKARRFKL